MEEVLQIWGKKINRGTKNPRYGITSWDFYKSTAVSKNNF